MEVFTLMIVIFTAAPSPNMDLIEHKRQYENHRQCDDAAFATVIDAQGTGTKIDVFCVASHFKKGWMASFLRGKEYHTGS